MCLLARRFAEAGVRFIQVSVGAAGGTDATGRSVQMIHPMIAIEQATVSPKISDSRLIVKASRVLAIITWLRVVKTTDLHLDGDDSSGG